MLEEGGAEVDTGGLEDGEVEVDAGKLEVGVVVVGTVSGDPVVVALPCVLQAVGKVATTNPVAATTACFKNCRLEKYLVRKIPFRF